MLPAASLTAASLCPVSNEGRRLGILKPLLDTEVVSLCQKMLTIRIFMIKHTLDNESDQSKY